MEFRGAAAEVRWVYHRAAQLADCTITPADDRRHYFVVATVVEANAFMLEHGQPLVFVLLRGEHPPWCWPIESCGINDEDDKGIVFRAYVGPFIE